MSTITISNLRKFYGRIPAVDGFSLEIPGASVFGLLGPNGAGKTTTFKCMLGLARPTSGEILYDGKPLVPETFERIAYVPERSVLYDWMTVEEHVEMTRRAFRAFDPARAFELLAHVQHRPAPPRARAFQRNAHRGDGRAGLRAQRGDSGARRTDRRPRSGQPTARLEPHDQRGGQGQLGHLFVAPDRSSRARRRAHRGHGPRAARPPRPRRRSQGRSQDRRRNLPRRQLHARRDRQRFARGANRSHRADRPAARHRRRGRDRRARFPAPGAMGVRVLDLNLEDIFLYAVSPATATTDVVAKESSS